jgi:hypothetical protein
MSRMILNNCYDVMCFLFSENYFSIYLRFVESARFKKQDVDSLYINFRERRIGSIALWK